MDQVKEVRGLMYGRDAANSAQAPLLSRRSPNVRDGGGDTRYWVVQHHTPITCFVAAGLSAYNFILTSPVFVQPAHRPS